MSESFEEENYICIEIDVKTPMAQLCKRFDELFPGRMIRLMVDKKNTHWYYIGNNLWIYNKPKENIDFKFNVKLFENPIDYLTELQINLIQTLDVNLIDFKVAGSVELFKNYYNGVFFTNGQIHIIDQQLFEESIHFMKNFFDFAQYETIIDLTNEENTGMCIFKTIENFLGDNDDKSNSQRT
jgi:hypothetical protein